jgi:hypothetical protein
VSLPDEASGKFRLYVLDFPESKGLLKDGLLITPTSTVRQAVETLQPVVISTTNPGQFPPEVHEELALVEGTKSVCVTPLVSHALPSQPGTAWPRHLHLCLDFVHENTLP